MSQKYSGYFNTGGKITKVTGDGLRINVYPSGIVASQLPSQSYSGYKSNLGGNFSNMTQQQMTDYSFNRFNKK